MFILIGASDNDNIVDLDEYRRRRVEEGTWPPDEGTVREYWKERRNRGNPAPPEPPKDQGAARGHVDDFWPTLRTAGRDIGQYLVLFLSGHRARLILRPEKVIG